MHFDVLTLFPHVITPYIQASIMQKAISNKIISITSHNLRDWAVDKHHTTDDAPFGGGGGMVMKPEPIFAAVEDIQQKYGKCPIVLMTPQGKQLNHAVAVELSSTSRMIILCGRYEGVDERIRMHLVTDEISIGDYVLSGGELPALVLMEAITRLLPGALGAPNGAADDSFASGLLEYPHYTRPAVYRNWEVPDILTSGNHQAVQRWRREQAWKRTLRKRPDLAKSILLDAVDIEILKEIMHEGEINLPISITNILGGKA
ncbi:MAG: tRNA (guanosine(37)-N1)-methyltransferase TrmD [Anaerolineaceae bacterium]|nr:tRNA (guanosine(37)-N1)-methyltransferase TrmD [Anaerolineaceae bacterium]